MKSHSHGKIVVTLIALVLVSCFAGVLIGFRISQQDMQIRFNPETWNDYAVKLLEQKLRLSNSQKEKIIGVIEKAVVEMKQVHLKTKQQTIQIVNEMMAGIDQELTPEQRVIAETLVPKEEEMTIDLLKVQSKKK